MQPEIPGPDEIRRFVHAIGQAGGSPSQDQEQIELLRQFFGRRVLRASVDEYVLDKYRAHVEGDLHWPEDTTPEEYLESLRQTVLDRRGAVYSGFLRR